MKTQKVIYAARVTDVGDKLVPTGDEMVSLFTERPYIDGENVECSVRPFDELRNGMPGVDMPEDHSAVVKITITAETV